MIQTRNTETKRIDVYYVELPFVDQSAPNLPRITFSTSTDDKVAISGLLDILGSLHTKFYFRTQFTEKEFLVQIWLDGQHSSSDTTTKVERNRDEDWSTLHEVLQKLKGSKRPTSDGVLEFNFIEGIR